ncbi:hypothetical protein [Streptomyces sp. NPDC056948]|uniref:hypothetical protein n=1 Tax=Streptomyces sp. NPDC056948 TaxID=3345975 RepID=UPI0036340F93
MNLITEVDALDVRFPTSRQRDGSDALNPEPDYSAAYVTVRTSDGDEGHGLAFTVGRGNEVQVAAVRALAPLVTGLPVEETLADLGAFSRRLTGDGQLRWLGPEKGAIHMAAAAVVNAVWDLYGRHLSMFDYVAVSGSTDDRVIEYVDHLHEHFIAPVRISGGRYVTPTAPGLGAQLRPASVADHLYPDGPVWSSAATH